ncbi:MAG: hypothetical protein GYB68_17315 [Chloroflexi bacterium]|nr:hypothetical protein [Chloroflexota bacterium]
MSDSISTPLREFRVLLLIWFGLRVLVLMTHGPILDPDGYPMGLLTFGELINFLRLAEITEFTGTWPYFGYWVEYPPLFIFVNTAIHQLTAAGPGAVEQNYYYTLILISFAADFGNLILMRKIGTHIYGEARGLNLAWIYAFLPTAFIFMWWNFELWTTFFMLLGLWLVLSQKDISSGVATAAGFLTKIFPVMLAPAVWKFRERAFAIRYTVALAGVALAAYLPLLVLSPQFTLASLQSQLGKSSWQTVWALMDGNFITGNFGGLSDRLDPALATLQVGNPAVIPSGITFIVFVGIGLVFFLQPMRQSDRALVAFFGITWCVFLLWSKGWSPQWMAMLLPLVLIVFPDRQGVLWVLVFAAISFLEWPILFTRGMENPGLYLTAPLRTVFLVVLIAMFYQQCRPLAGRVTTQPA